MRFIDVKVCSAFLFLIFQTLPAFGTGVDSVPSITSQERNSMLTRVEEVVIFDVRGGISKEKYPVVIADAGWIERKRNPTTQSFSQKSSILKTS